VRYARIRTGDQEPEPSNCPRAVLSIGGRCGVLLSMTARSDRAAAGPQPGQVVDDLYREHAVGLVRFALMLVGDPTTAEDVVQEAFLGLYQGWHRVRDPGSVLGYLRAAVLNGSRNVLRSRRRAGLLRAAHDPPVWSAEAAAMDGEDRRAVLAAVARLPLRQREVLALRYYLDLGEQEIAVMLGISRGTVSSTVSRALAALARDLRGDNDG
jgi:RNA polymerase sigma-70 factor (sigma-E family)